MSGAISNKNRLREGLEYVACLRGHRGPNSLSGTVHQCCICFSVSSVHMPRWFLSMHGLKQTVKIVLLNVLEMILVKKTTSVNVRERLKKPIKSQLWRFVRLCSLSCSKILSDIASGFQLF